MTDRLPDAEYEQRTRDLLADIEATVDRLLQDDVVDIDASRTGGMLEMRFPDGGTIVVNTQPPLQELWLAAPAGGFHFRAVGDRWVENREGREFHATLSEFASALAGRPLDFAAG